MLGFQFFLCFTWKFFETGSFVISEFRLQLISVKSSFIETSGRSVSFFISPLFQFVTLA